MKLFGPLARVIAVPIQVCSFAQRLVEVAGDIPRERTVLEDLADAVREFGKELDGEP